MLGGGVGRSVRLANEAADRSDVYHIASMVLTEVNDTVLEREKDRLQIDPHQFVPITHSVLMQGANMDNPSGIDNDL